MERSVSARISGPIPTCVQCFSRVLVMLIFHLAFVSVMTFILIISSVTMVLAVHAGHKGDKKGVIKWMAWTIVGGLAFLGCQAWEWHHLITGEHAVLVDGKIEMVGQTYERKSLGQSGRSMQMISNALKNTSHETLAKSGA